jgi:hypothetical protein
VFMLRRVLVLGLVGALALIGGCASGLTESSKSANAPATSVARLTEPTTADKAVPTKQVTLSVSGMT